MSITQLASRLDCRLWHVDLDATPTPHAVASLSDAEWERARRFVFRQDRNRFVAAHAALRDTLSAQTDVHAAMLDFAHGAFGKPALADAAAVRFNLSHSQSVALIAVHDDADVGVDVELLRPMPDAEALARSYFSEAELDALSRIAPTARDLAFLTCWTRKEACLKATGMGLSVDTRSFDVGVMPDSREVRIAGGDGVTRLELASFDDVQGAVCAVARVLAYDDAPAVPRRLAAESESYA